jgi:hypothetical protein
VNEAIGNVFSAGNLKQTQAAARQSLITEVDKSPWKNQ